MTEILLADSAFGIGAIVELTDWSATTLSFSFLVGGLLSLYVSKHPTDVAQRFGFSGLAFGTLVTFLFSVGCMLQGTLSLMSGQLMTPNGVAFTGATAYAGGIGFAVLGAVILTSAWRNVRAINFETAASTSQSHNAF